jgi:hypothetical protein
LKGEKNMNRRQYKKKYKQIHGCTPPEYYNPFRYHPDLAIKICDVLPDICEQIRVGLIDMLTAIREGIQSTGIALEHAGESMACSYCDFGAADKT